MNAVAASWHVLAAPSCSLSSGRDSSGGVDWWSVHGANRVEKVVPGRLEMIMATLSVTTMYE